MQIIHAWQQNWNTFNVNYFSKILNIQTDKYNKYKVAQRNKYYRNYPLPYEEYNPHIYRPGKPNIRLICIAKQKPINLHNPWNWIMDINTGEN
jgi:hypothetical protein